MTSVRLTRDNEQGLAALAAELRQTKSYLINAALEEYLEDQQDTFTGLRALREVDEGKDHIPMEEVLSEFGFTRSEPHRLDAPE
jgi:predicted DNA-binding protein